MAGLQGGTLELITALHTALETPDIAERWLAGERVFTPDEPKPNHQRSLRVLGAIS